MNQAIKNIEKEIERIIDILKLKKSTIEYHNELYYVKATPMLTDYEYDMLVKDYNNDYLLAQKNMDKLFDLLDENDSDDDSISCYNHYDMLLSDLELQVGSSIVEGSNELKMKHDIPMLSLDNSYNIHDIKQFMMNNVLNELTSNEGAFFVFEDKVDGISCSLKYENGIFVRALTRGDGETGEVITDKVMQIGNIPFKLSKNIDIEIRGELVLPVMSLDEINNTMALNKKYKNCRNACAGIIRQKLNNTVNHLLRHIKFIAYQIPNTAAIIQYPDINKSHVKSLEFLKHLNFEVVHYDILTKETIESHSKNIEPLIESILQNVKNYPREYEIDGCVIKYDNKTQYEQIGRTSKFPKWATAFKYKDAEFVTKVLDITWQVGRTGKVTPVAELSPIMIQGSLVSRATLHNIDELTRLRITPGCDVVVIKSATVIPKVLKRHNDDPTKKVTITFPTHCSSCYTKLEKIGTDFVCTNPKCSERVIQSIIFFAGRECYNIEGLGEGIVKQLYLKGLLTDIESIFDLKKHKVNMMNLEGFGKRKVESLLQAIENSKKNDVYRLIAGFGFAGVGKTTSKLLIGLYGSLQGIYDNIKSPADLVKINSIGEVSSLQIMSFIEKIPSIISFCNAHGINTSGLNVAKSDIFKGKTFLLTGKYEHNSRNEYQKLITERMGKVVSSVTKSLTYIVPGKEATQHKVDKARELGVEFITEERLKDMMGN
ncbi:MAG: NAD-dependent DNA ligase LigA [Peptostreptococcaceae bacterium]